MSSKVEVKSFRRGRSWVRSFRRRGTKKKVSETPTSKTGNKGIIALSSLAGAATLGVSFAAIKNHKKLSLVLSDLEKKIPLKGQGAQARVAIFKSGEIVKSYNRASSSFIKSPEAAYLGEVKALEKLANTGIVPKILVKSDSRLAFVMEEVKGKSAFEIFSGKLSESDILGFTKKISDAVDIIHQNGVFHGDLHSNNIIISDTGDVKIIDFGLSEISDKPPSKFKVAREKKGIFKQISYAVTKADYRKNPQKSEEDVKAFEESELGQRVKKSLSFSHRNTEILEFRGLKEARVAVKGFMRGGKMVRGFKRRTLLKDAAKEAGKKVGIEAAKVGGVAAIKAGVDKAKESGPALVQKALLSGELPTRKEGLLALARASTPILRHPVRSVREGFTREKALMDAISSQTGREVSKSEVIQSGLRTAKQQIQEKLTDPNLRKELSVNTVGFLSSKAAKLSGIPGAGVAGDLIGARVARQSIDDTEVLKSVLGRLQGTKAYDEAGRLGKIRQIFQASKQLKAQQAAERRTSLAGDVTGWAAGNFAAVPGVPLGGTISGMTAGILAEKIQSQVPPKTYQEALATVLSSNIRKGNKREQALRVRVKRGWGKLKEGGIV